MSILSFLSDYRSKTGPYTHIGWAPTLGSFSVPKEKMDDFYECYTKAILDGEISGLCETHGKLGPVVIDIDIKYELDEGYTRRYTEEDIKTIVKLYNEQIRTFFESGQDLTAYVFEKPSPTKANGNMKDGLHIMYPNIVSESDIQFAIRNTIVDYVNEHNLFSSWKCKNKIDDVFDKAVIESAGWVMYGGQKMQQNPYVLTKIVDDKLNVITEGLPFLKECPRMFSIRNKEIETSLSDKGHQVRKNRVSKVEVVQTNMMYRSPVDVDDIELAKKLVAILDKQRADDYTSWLEVGMCLFNIDINLLDQWITFSKQSSKYKDGECEKNWSTFKHKGLSIGSLHRWAKIDNKELYSKTVDDGTREVLMESLSGTNYDVARVLHRMYKYQYVCASAKAHMWFEFKGHRWVEIENGMSLKQKISTVLATKYRSLTYYYSKKLIEVADEATKKSLEEKMEKARKLSNNVKDTSFKTKIMSECVELFYDPKFYQKLDSQTHLIGFENGVYDLENSEFRDGRPEDYVSFSTFCDYVPFESTNYKVMEAMKFIREVLTDQEVREYVLTLMSSFLDGQNYDQKFHFWKGTGANGKSTLVELFEDSFGDYACSVPHTILTQKRSGSSAANPEIAKLRGKRFVHMQEPEGNDKINVGYLKELSGGDKIQARELYKAPVEFKPQFHLILACNDLPQVTSTDGGTWRRVRVVEFASKFVDEPLNDNEFKKDYNLGSKLSTWHEAFISILIDRYNKVFKQSGHLIKEPKCITICTKEYQRISDSMLDYIEENIEITNDKKDRLGILNLYTHFKEWYQSSYGEKAPPKRELKTYLEKKFGTMKSNGFTGLRYVEHEIA